MKEIKELVDVALLDDDFLVGQKTTGETGKITKQDFLDSIITALSEPIGTMKAFAGATAPDGYFICDGSAKSRTTYAALFGVISTTYGAGDGSTTFNIPNAQGLTLKGAGSQDIGGRAKSAGALGTVQEDQMQQITGSANAGAYSFSWTSSNPTYEGAFTTEGTGVATNASTSSSASSGFTFDSADSPNARTSATTDGATRDSSLAVNYIIKY